jgi:hypothetical protein
MKHEVYIDNEQSVVCCTLDGELEIERAITLSKNLRSQSAELGFNLFYDARKLYITDHILPDDFTTILTTLLQKLSTLLEISSHRIVRVAILYELGEYEEYWKFYEGVAVNRGLAIKIFTKQDEAMEWLSD